LPSIILAHINLVFKKYNNNREKERKKIPFSVLRIVTRYLYRYASEQLSVVFLSLILHVTRNTYTG